MCRKHLTVVALAVAAALVVAACGSTKTVASSTSGGRTINVAMHDIGFSPTSVDVKAGESVRFVFDNTGKLAHEAFIGDDTAQMGHENQMKDMGAMSGMDHTGDAGITVDAGKTGTLTHTFSTAGTTLIGCHEPGHYAAGMKIDVHVT